MTPCFQHDSYQRSCGDCRDMSSDEPMTEHPTDAMERAALLYLVDECDTLVEAELNIDRVRKLMAEGVTALHDGDCTHQAHTCLRCLTDDYINRANILNELEAAKPSTPTCELNERVAAILKRQRANRYAEEAIATSDLIDEDDAREIIAAILKGVENVR